MGDGDTIVALSSGNPPSGVAIVRLSGPGALAVLEGLAGPLPPPRQLRLREIRHAGAMLDRGFVAVFPAPASFTGEDCAELHLHGSPAVVRAVLAAATAGAGVRLAKAGEFTRRAFENGKLDLTEAEGLGDLIDAETESQRAMALARASGELTARIEEWRLALLDLRAGIEAQLDFSDEGDVADGISAEWRATLHALQTGIALEIADVGRGRIVREGFRVALAGAPNAGKSRLVNALARSDLAIVSDEAGTTRDVREVALDLNGRLAIIVDMAGLRQASGKAETEGVRRAEAEIAAADLVVWLVAPDVPDIEMLPPTKAPVWRVASKADLGARTPNDCRFNVSSVTTDGAAALGAAISEAAKARIGDGAGVLVSRERDRSALADAVAALGEVEASLGQPEIAAEALRVAADRLARLLGRMDAETVLDRVFSRFCIGK